MTYLMPPNAYASTPSELVVQAAFPGPPTKMFKLQSEGSRRLMFDLTPFPSRNFDRTYDHNIGIIRNISFLSGQADPT